MRRTRSRRRGREETDEKEVELKKEKRRSKELGGLRTSRFLCFLGSLSYGFGLLAEET